MVVSPGIHAARHRLKRILTLIGLFPHWRALPRVRLTVMVGGRVRRSGRGLKMTCARRPCERATVRVRVVVHPNRWPRDGPVRAGAPTSTGIVHPCLRPPAVRRLLAVPSGVGQRPRRRAKRRQQQRLRRVCRGHQDVHDRRTPVGGELDAVGTPLDDPVDPVDGDTLERRRPRWLIAADGDDRRVTPSPSGRAIDAHRARLQRADRAGPETTQRLTGGAGGPGRQRHGDRGSPRARTPDRGAQEGDGESEQGGIPAGAGVPPQGASRATAQMCTTVHVSVRVMPGTS